MEFPKQQSTDRCSATGVPDNYDMREHLLPRRLTLAMWDQAFALRHGPGGSFADYDRVLDETVERGYNTVRLDPMPQWVDLSHPEKIPSTTGCGAGLHITMSSRSSPTGRTSSGTNN